MGRDRGFRVGPLRWLAGAALWGAVVSAWVGPASTLAAPGTSVPTRLAFGLQRHPAPTPGVNVRRDGITKLRLPRRLTLKWRAHVPGGVAGGAVIGDGGSITTGTPNGSLVAFGPEGRQRWSRKLAGRISSNVGILADGTRVVATRGGFIQGFREDGREAMSTRPGFRHPDEITTLLPLPDGSFVCASLRQIIWLDGDGTRRAEAELTDTVLALYYGEETVVAATRSGDVFAWDGSRSVRSLGGFGGPLRALPVLRRGELLGLTHDSVRAKSLATGRLRPVVSQFVYEHSAQLALAREGQLAWLDSDNALIRASRDGIERTPLGARTTGKGATLAPLSDGRGNLVLVDALGQVASVDREGRVSEPTEVRCHRPVALLPQAQRRVVLVCATGSIWGFGD